MGKLILVLVAAYLWWTFPPTPEDCKIANDGGTRGRPLSAATHAAKEIVSGKYDSCLGLIPQWKDRATSIPRQLGLLPKQSVDEVSCYAGADVMTGVVYFGWRHLGYDSCTSQQMMPHVTDDPKTAKAKAQDLLNQVE